MKTITIRTLIICLSFTFFSCDKDEKEEVNENLLLGTWLLTREIDSDGEDDSYESNCRNTWTFTSSQITASYDDNCDGTSDETFTESYTLSNNEDILKSGSCPSNVSISP